MSYNEYRNTGSYPPAESGPRRSTPSPSNDEVAAANAAAARLADEMGISSSARANSVRRGEPTIELSSRSVNFPRTNRSNTSNTTQNTAASASAYSSMDRMEQFQTEAAAAQSNNSLRFSSGYRPPSVTTVDTDDNSVKEPITFDQHGNRAPYRQGPYDYSHHPDGLLIKKRWCKYHIHTHILILAYHTPEREYPFIVC